MNSIKNSVFLIGHLGKDPELRQFDNGRCMAKFSLATSEYYTNKDGEKVQRTEWHNLVGWGKTAELMDRLLAKGKEVAVRGKLTYNQYEDKEGVKRSFPQVQVNEFVILSKKEEV